VVAQLVREIEARRVAHAAPSNDTEIHAADRLASMVMLSF
jgi:hypothetical protein